MAEKLFPIVFDTSTIILANNHQNIRLYKHVYSSQRQTTDEIETDFNIMAS